MDGMELLRQLNSVSGARKLPVIVMTGHGDVPLAVEAMKLGALDFLEKPFEDDRLIGMIETALSQNEGGAKSDAVTADMAARVASLTQRERQVMQGLVTGQSNKVIAREYDISPRTVEVYRANVMTKMQAGSLSELVRFAIRAGLSRIEPSQFGQTETGYLADDDRRPSHAIRPLPRSARPAKKSMIYVVDDDYDVLKSLRFLLETEGFEVRTFRSGSALLGSLYPARRGLPCRGLQNGGNRRAGACQQAARSRCQHADRPDYGLSGRKHRGESQLGRGASGPSEAQSRGQSGGMRSKRHQPSRRSHP